MDYSRAIEKRDYAKIDKLNTLTNKKTFWDDVRKFTKNVTSNHAIRRWQCLAEFRWNELNNFLRWNDLTEAEKEQAENSFLSILEDMASGGDEYDIADYEMTRDDRYFRLHRLQCKSFIRDDDGYIFVNM